MPMFKNKTALVGVDLIESSNTVCITELDKKGQIKTEAICSSTNIEIALSQALDKANPSISKAAIAMPFSAVILKSIEFDNKISELEIEAYILANCQKIIGLPAAKINLDFNINKHLPKNKTKVDIYATRAEWITAKTSLLTKASLQVVAADIDSFALLRAVQQQENIVGITAIASFTPDGIVFFITDNGQIAFYQKITSIEEGLERYNASNYGPIQKIFLLNNTNSSEQLVQTQKAAGIPCALLTANFTSSWLSYGLALRGVR